MAKTASVLAGAALLLAGCGDAGQGSEPPTAQAETISAICPSLKTASPAADVLMQSAFGSSPAQLENERDKQIESLVGQGGYSFLGSEMVEDTCWAYAEAKGVFKGQASRLSWRCPVKAYRSGGDASVVELVENDRCDFDVQKGDPKRQDVSIEILKL